jgi:hypothetical protein
LKGFEAKRVDFENRIPEYKDVFEKQKHRKPPFPPQKTISNETPSVIQRL